MIDMILKMTAITGLMCGINVLLWSFAGRRELKKGEKLLIGVVFGLLAVLSTHFGVDYDKMMLNVRDIAPLSAGLFFGPAAGITAGLIGGIERYIVGSYFDVGAYTTIACSVSTCLAGFIAAAFSHFTFKGKEPSPFFALFIGCVTEVFHMFAVFLTHRDDITNAFNVVKICAVPMIIFTGIGMFTSALIISARTGGLKAYLYAPKSQRHIASRFLTRVFAAIMVLTCTVFIFFYSIQTRQAVQTAESELRLGVEEMVRDLGQISIQRSSAAELSGRHALTLCRAAVREINDAGGISAVTDSRLEELKALFDVHEISAVGSDGIVAASTEPAYKGFDMYSQEETAEFMVLAETDREEYLQTYREPVTENEGSVLYCGVKAKGGFVELGIDKSSLSEYEQLSRSVSELADRHIGDSGIIYITDKNGKILSKNNYGRNMAEFGCDRADGTFFYSDITGVSSYCLMQKTDEHAVIAAIPEKALFLSRDISAYETAFADILIFTLIFLLIYILVQNIIVNDLNKVNVSLNRITGGDLNEEVKVSDSLEFASLSHDINVTVDTLKRYISEAENRINKELEFARSIQTSTLPNNFDFPSRDEFAVHACMYTAKEVGGDFYDLFFVDKNKLALVIADVSGKGIPAALFMMRSKATIKGFAESGLEPAEIFTRANAMLCEGNDTEMFVTAWIGIIDLETGVMQCANAGHEYPAIKRCGGSYELLKDKHCFVLGGQSKIKYKQYELVMQAGDKLFVYTDGVAEANDVSQQLLGTERMISALNANADASPEQTLAYMKQYIDDFCGEAEQFDDITMLDFHYIKNTDAPHP